MTRIGAGEITAFTTARDRDGHLHLAAQVVTEGGGLVMGTLHVDGGGHGDEGRVRFRPVDGLVPVAPEVAPRASAPGESGERLTVDQHSEPLPGQMRVPGT